MKFETPREKGSIDKFIIPLINLFIKIIAYAVNQNLPEKVDISKTHLR